VIRRIVTVVLVLGACVAAVVLTGASDEAAGKSYKAEFDNAFGLTEGGDLRIGGVQAGQTTGFSVSDTEPVKAVVEFTISEPGFDSLREDARCEVRQQSLIGEYYVDCQPGTSETELPEDGTIPVEQTASIIPADLVNNVLREPYRERLRLIIAELGTGLAGRPEDLAETLERAHPGLRETNKVLEILGNQTDVLRNFVSDSDEVVDDLARNRGDVARFVREARDTAAISATRKEELAEQFEKLPTFLAELDPTMVRLGQLADAQIPLLADLRAASSDLERFFTELGPFSQASRPAIDSLGETGVTGSAAIKESADEVRELKQVARGAGGVGEPLRQFLQTIDDRSRAVDQDLRTPNTDPPRFDPTSLKNRRNRNLDIQGFTGFESVLNYFFWQTLSINSFDGISHLLRSLLIVDERDPSACSKISIEPTREEIAGCNTYTGPNQPGIDAATGTIEGRDYGPYDPDPTERAGGSAASAQSSSRPTSAEKQAAREQSETSAPVGELPPEVEGLLEGLQSRSGTDTGAPEAPAPDVPTPGAGPLREGLPGAAPQDGPATGSELSLPQKGVAAPGQSGSLPEGQSAPGAPVPPDMLLDFLLGP